MEVICYGAGREELPENSIEGIQHCQNVDQNWWIEIDIQLTKDGNLVLFHDEDISRVTGQKGQIKDLSLLDMEKLNIGYYFDQDGESPYSDLHIKINLNL